MKNRYQYIALIFSFFSLMAFASANVDDNNFPVSAKVKPHKDPVDGGWLPNLTGLPDEAEISLLDEQVAKAMAEEKDSRCNQIDDRLRMMVFQHFLIHQHLANGQNIYFNENNVKQWAHILAMTLKESSGDSTNVTDMTGRSISTYESQTDYHRWKNMLNAAENRLKMNYQTNFGLTQTSADRLFLAFHLAKNQGYNTEFLVGKEGLSSAQKINLNTAIAIRRLIWFYQDFAQGRFKQEDPRIHYKQRNKPENAEKLAIGAEKALLYCGTNFMFHDKNPSHTKELENGMASIAYCKLGNSQAGYGKSKFDEYCFAQWVTLCPALNIDIALMTPLNYFATKGEKPVCEATFQRLLIKKPNSP